MDFTTVVERFKQLGLTDYQSRVLYALLVKKSCTIAEIGSVSSVPNTRVYDVVNQLLERSFIMKIHDKPKTYRVRNVSQVLDALYLEKDSELQKIKEDVTQMKEYFKYDVSNEETKFIKLARNEDLVNLLSEEFSKAKKDIVGFGHAELQNKKLQDILKDASGRINVRLITHPDHNVVLDFAKSRHHDISAYVIDNSKLILKLNENDKGCHLGIIHNQDGIKQMVKNHFETMWNAP